MGTVSSTNAISSSVRKAWVSGAKSTSNSCLSWTMCPENAPMSATFRARTALMRSCESSQNSSTSLVTERRQMAFTGSPSGVVSTSPSKVSSRTSATTHSTPASRTFSAKMWNSSTTPFSK